MTATTRMQVIWQKAESSWQVHRTPLLHFPGGSIKLKVCCNFRLHVLTRGTHKSLIPCGSETLIQHNVSLDPKSKPPKWHLKLLNSLSKVQCTYVTDKRPHYGYMCRTRQNCLHCKSDSPITTRTVVAATTTNTVTTSQRRKRKTYTRMSNLSLSLSR